MKIITDMSPALILIDIQEGFKNEAYWGGKRNNPDAEIRASELLDYWRKNELPLFHIQHISTNPSSMLSIDNPGHVFQELVKPLPGEIIVQKSVNSAFIGTNLKEQLDAKGIRTVVIAGLTTDHCVSTTTRMAGNYGYKTYLVADATATFGRNGTNGQYFDAETMHQSALAQLNEEFATVVFTQDIIN